MAAGAEHPGPGGVDHQVAYRYIAATLNIANGADAPAHVTQSLATLRAYFDSSTPRTKLTKPQESSLLAAARVLGAWNNGYAGTPHCA